jgi:hypothetical protein
MKIVSIIQHNMALRYNIFSKQHCINNFTPRDVGKILLLVRYIQETVRVTLQNMALSRTENWRKQTEMERTSPKNWWKRVPKQAMTFKVHSKKKKWEDRRVDEESYKWGWNRLLSNPWSEGKVTTWVYLCHRLRLTIASGEHHTHMPTGPPKPLPT